MNLKILKLISGEEIVGEVDLETENSVTLNNPLAIMLRPSQDGFTFGFVPWCNLMDCPKQISVDKIITSGPPNEDVKNAYSSMFGGIVTPSKKLLV